MMDTQTTHKLITPFADGVILHHPDPRVSDMISLEKRGAYWLKREHSKPLDLPELAVMLNRWYRGQFSKGLKIYSLSRDDEHAKQDNWKTTIWESSPDEDNTSRMSIFNNQIVCTDGDFYNPFLTIPEAADILKRWYE